jgi:hypothetical protein
MRIAGLILLAAGVLWTLQGMGILRGSVMTGSRFWLRAGIACLAVGTGMVAWSFF